jgi:hypothetical protein
MEQALRPKAVIQFGRDGKIEDLAAWIMEPALGSPRPVLAQILSDVPKPWNAQMLGRRLQEAELKGDWQLHENLAWEVYGYPACNARVSAFLNDVARICSNGIPQSEGWQISVVPQTEVPLYTADFVRNTV